MSVVVDASITIAWLFVDEADAASLEVAKMVTATGAIVPSLWRFEIANVLRNAERRGRCDGHYVDQSLAGLAQLPIATEEGCDERVWDAILQLARSDDLTVYDAAYLELARRLGLSLATRDRELIDAAARHQVPVIGGVIWL